MWHPKPLPELGAVFDVALGIIATTLLFWTLVLFGLVLEGCMGSCDGKDPGWETNPDILLGQELEEAMRDAGTWPHHDAMEETSP